MTWTVSVAMPSTVMPWFMMPMTRPPMTAPMMVPTPPVTDAPPMNDEAMADSSSVLPAPGVAECRRAVTMTPARPAIAPMITNTQNVVCLVFTPESSAAFSLPPPA
nr:hypothetical protein GCM10025732_17420 [Glycomyces mayteni]